MRHTRLSVAMLAGLSVLAAGCKTDLTSLNENPNSPTTATPGSLFTNATASAVGQFLGPGYQLSLVELLAQHIAQVQYVDEDRFAYRVGTIAGYFTGAYINPLMNLQVVSQAGTDAKSPNITGPAEVVKAWVFQQMTDLWGDIPYSEALKGSSGPLKPKYDAQKDIYYGMLKALTDASSAMTAGGTGLGAADRIYGGDATKWKKFANSLRARLALRIQKADAAKADAELRAAFAAAGGVFTSNADNAQLAWPGDGVFDNPWSNTFSTRDDHRVSKTLLDTMNALKDPRVKYYAQPTTNDATKYAGLQNGLNNATASPFIPLTSRVGAMFYPGVTTYGTYGTTAGKKSPSFIMTFAELSFIMAEAANRGVGGLTASQAAGFYTAGVTASVKQWGGSDADAAAYLAQPGVAYASGPEGLNQIGLQKWIAFFTQGEEAWSEWRRTGNPVSIKPGPKATLTYMPRRMTYSINEQSVNSENLQAAIARQGPDNFQTRMWWDK